MDNADYQYNPKSAFGHWFYKNFNNYFFSIKLKMTPQRGNPYFEITGFPDHVQEFKCSGWESRQLCLW